MFYVANLPDVLLLNCLCFRMAACEERHHLCCILREIKAHHFFVEFLCSGCGNADGIDPMRHQHTVHHEARCTFIAIKEELLQRTKQKKMQLPAQTVRTPAARSRHCGTPGSVPVHRVAFTTGYNAHARQAPPPGCNSSLALPHGIHPIPKLPCEQ